MRSLAMLAKLRGDSDEAERLLRAAVDADDVEAMWEMGRLVEDLPTAECVLSRQALISGGQVSTRARWNLACTRFTRRTA